MRSFLAAGFSAVLLLAQFGLVASAQTVQVHGTGAPIVLEDFPDVPSGSRNYVAIGYLRSQGILLGNPDGTFRPEDPVNRAEAVSLILRYLELRDGPTVPVISDDRIKDYTFSDLEDGAWYVVPILNAVHRGLVSGHPDGTFRPNNQLNNAEALAMISRALLISEEVTLDNLPPDVPKDAWFASLVAYGTKYFLVNPADNGNLNPGKVLTRAEFSEIFYRALSATQIAQAYPAYGIQFGRASWYGDGLSKIYIEDKAAFHAQAMTAASKEYPLGSVVRVTNLRNGKFVDVLINDRGPFVPGRVIDLSRSSFSVIGDAGKGITEVRIEALYIPAE